MTSHWSRSRCRRNFSIDMSIPCYQTGAEVDVLGGKQPILLSNNDAQHKLEPSIQPSWTPPMQCCKAQLWRFVCTGRWNSRCRYNPTWSHGCGYLRGMQMNPELPWCIGGGAIGLWGGPEADIALDSPAYPGEGRLCGDVWSSLNQVQMKDQGICFRWRPSQRCCKKDQCKS